MKTRRGWRSRGHLPHADFAGLAQAITFRLADALPDSVLTRLRTAVTTESMGVDNERRQALLSTKIHEWLDAGHGACVLRRPDLCRLMLHEIVASHEHTCRLDAVVVMPNHVHVLVHITGTPIGELVQRWKGSSARRINTVLGNRGSLWQREYFDRFIRDEAHHIAALRYIVQNPVQARLVDRAEEWPGLWVAENLREVAGLGRAAD